MGLRDEDDTNVLPLSLATSSYLRPNFLMRLLSRLMLRQITEMNSGEENGRAILIVGKPQIQFMRGACQGQFKRYF